MTRQVLFVHGAGEGAHACDSKLAMSLREKLGAGYVVHYPMMPDEANPDYGAWTRCIGEELARLGNDVVLAGHSIGASVLIRFLTAGALQQSVAGVFLIAAPFWHDHEVWRWKEAELPVDAADMLPSGVPVFLYHGREDEIAPFSHLALYAKTFPQAIVRALDGRNHQLNDDLTEVADDIRHLA
jgi:predicted alpha/beta hydrolase family esterase